MKNKKLLPTIILGAAVLVMMVYLFITSIALKPSVTEGEFPFSITYELDGETVTINDVYRARYDRNDGYADTKSRVYVGEIGNLGEENTVYTLKKSATGRIELYTQFYADHLMGDSEYDYFDVFEPQIYYYDAQEQAYGDEETLLAQGVKLISFEYPAPIENTLVFSHLSYFSGEIVIPLLLISLVALVVMMITVKKEKDLQYKAIDVISIVLNFVVTFTLVPFTAILGVFIDIDGGGPELYYQFTYFISSISMLCVAASVALRRKGYGVKSLIVGLAGPAAFVVFLIVCAVLNLM